MKPRSGPRQSKSQSAAGEETFRLLFHEHPLPMWMYDLETLAFLEVNHAAVEHYGYAREEFLGMTLNDIHPSKAGTRRPGGAAEKPLEMQQSGEWRHTLKGGRTIDVEITSHTLEYRGRQVSLAVVHDITSRKDAEELIRRSEIRHRSLFENMQEGFAYCRMIFENDDPVDFEYLEVNDAFEKITGLKYIVGKRVSEAIPGIRTSNPELFQIYGRVARTGKPERFETYVKPLNIWFFISVYSMQQGYFAAVFNDITERKQVQDALLKTERRFHQLFDEAPVGYHECDFQGRLTQVNRTELEMLGYAAEQMLGRPVWEFIVEGETSREAIAAKIAGSGQSDQPFERTFRRGDGTTLSALITDRALRSEDGKVIGIRSTVQDVTARKKADRQLRLMAQTVASAQDCISITDLEDRFLFVNDAFRNTYGYSTEDLLGKDVSVLRSPQTPAAVTDQILQRTQGGGWHGEILNRRKDGSDFPVELWTSVVRDEAGTPVAMVGVARNISGRKVAEEQIRQSEEQFRLIAENVADMIAVLDLDGRRIYNSPSYRSILGDPDALKATDGFQEIHPDDRERVKQVFQETVATGIGQRIEYRFLLADGSVREIDSKGSVIRDAEGRIFRVIVVSRDVTEEKRLAAQFLRSQRMESIGTLAGGIAHDLNNVLAPIMMAIEVLRGKITDQGGQRILTTIETSARRGADIVRQVLAFGRGVKGERILVQLKHVVIEVARIAGETFPKSIEIRTNMPRDLWTVSADPTQMHQVLLNMLVNARDAMPKGGTLTVSAENVDLDDIYARMHLDAKPGAYVCLAITDTGTGIPPAIREKIFEPFFTTKEIGMGTGLGLSTTLAIVKSHEGFINLYSETGKGTTFRIYIPATGTGSRTLAQDDEEELPTGNGELILIIDDEAAIREITKETLQAYGYKAMTASDGAEGVALFAENKENIKVVITDIMMPVMDGTAAILVLRKISRDVKIIAASGLSVREKIKTPADSNVQAFLTKPYTAEKLLRALATALR